MKIIILILTLLTAGTARALDSWDGTSVSSSLRGSGTEADPYQIWTGADLKYLANQVNIEDNNRRLKNIHVLQMDDIDMNGHEWLAMGSGAFPFLGVYDGGGHTISNMYIHLDHYLTDDNHACAGFIGNLGAGSTIKRLALNKPKVSGHNVIATSIDLRVGLIAASVESGTTIKHCVVNDALVTDDGSSFKPRSLYVAGIAGNFNISYSETTNNMPGSSKYKGPVKIEHVAVHMNVDLPNTTTSPASAQYTQYNIGGIVGRMRRATINDIPDRCFFTGNINASRATISPLFGLVRGNGDNTHSAKYLARSYAGETGRTYNNTGNDDYDLIANPDSPDSTLYKKLSNDHRFYGNYNIYNIDKNKFEEITDVYPPHKNPMTGVRTLEPNWDTATGGETSKLFAHDNHTASGDKLGMRSYQGVNHGRYLNIEDDEAIQELLDSLNEDGDELPFTWSFKRNQVIFRGIEDVSVHRKTARRFLGVIDCYDPAKKYKFVWHAIDVDGIDRQVAIETDDRRRVSGRLEATETGLRSTLVIDDDPKYYEKIWLELYEGDTKLNEHTIYLSPLQVRIENATATAADGTNRHYLFSAVVENDDDIYPDPTTAPLEYEWQLYDEATGTWSDYATSSYRADFTDPSPMHIHVIGDFVGKVRLVVRDIETFNGAASHYVLTHSKAADGNDLNYVEQVVSELRLRFTVEELASLNADGTYTTQTFKHNDYYYEQGSKYTFYPITSTDPNFGTVHDTKVHPLIFRAHVVDQFGNEWLDETNADKWRVQWNYSIPGDGKNGKSPNYDEELFAATGEHYNRVNGLFDPTDTTGFGLQAEVGPETVTDWVGAYWRNRLGMTEPDATIDRRTVDRTGQYMVIDDGLTFIIHPNLLNTTNGSHVRALLYDVEADPTGINPMETFLEITQLGMVFSRGEESYTSTVGYPLSGEGYTSTSACTFKWYATKDPTDQSSWEYVTTTSIPAAGTASPRTSTITGIDTDMFYKVVYTSANGVELEDIVGPENVVYVYDRQQTLHNLDKHEFNPYDESIDHYFPDGQDLNHGHDPHNAVKTMDRAFEILTAYENGGRVGNNRVVIMGYHSEEAFLKESNRTKKKYAKPVTLSGRYGQYVSGGTLGLIPMPNMETHIALQAPMQMEHLALWNTAEIASDRSPVHCLYLYNHDFTMGEKVYMKHFPLMKAALGIDAATSCASLTIVLGGYDVDADMSKPENRIDYSMNEEPGVTTLTVRSGAIGRIIGGSRNNKVNGFSHNICGAYNNMHRSRINIDMIHPDGNESEYFIPYVKDGLEVNINTEIGLVVGGQTDGSLYGDVEVNLYNGHIARYASGNISYGRPADNYPSDSFFGRATLNFYGGRIDELFGGSIGRKDGIADTMDCFFYGRSEINIYGGVIGNEFSQDGRIYAAGAGGVSGLGSEWQTESGDKNKTYTIDKFIPYMNPSGTDVLYGDFDAVKASGYNMPVLEIFNSYDPETGQHEIEYLPLKNTRTEVNLYGGVINGDVFGGGYGYSNVMNWSNVPYREIDYGEGNVVRQALAGVFFGDTHVRLLPNPDPNKPDVLVKGSVYGCSSGSAQYHADYLRYKKDDTPAFDYSRLAQIFGNAEVEIHAGTVGGNVFAGGMGVEGYDDMANLYGNASLLMTGGEVKGNIFGGSYFANLKKYTDKYNGNEIKGGNTSVTIEGGTIGNCIFGGGMGSPVTGANCDGNTTVTITGGDFSTEPRSDYDHTGYNTLKNYNIYGGPCRSGEVENTRVYITRSPLVSEESLGLTDGQTFLTMWNDLTCRRFCVYGGGWGEKALVRGNTEVVINIEGSQYDEPSANPITGIKPGQMFFDVAGGGYSGDVGYWVDADGKPAYKKETTTVADFADYVGGTANISISGQVHTRKVVGGGFYGSVNQTNTVFTSGVTQEIYGGALLGYVHDYASLTIGTRKPDDVTDEDTYTEPENRRLFILGNVYGGNDVKGTVGTTFYENPKAGGQHETEEYDGGPLFAADVSDADDKGVMLQIYGGTILGNVFGAGNGHYRGYYVPGWLRYEDGPARHYTRVRSPYPMRDEYGNIILQGGKPVYEGYVYRSRPMTGSVKMDISGNSKADRVNVKGNVYGGGRSCTIGQWNTILPFEDPRRLTQGGFLHLNFGSHVLVEKNVYVGTEGMEYVTQNTLPEKYANLDDFFNDPNATVDDLGDIAYDHWYYNGKTKRYEPGYPAPGEFDGNYGMTGEHMFRGYMKNIEMNGDVEVTFYKNVYADDGHGGKVRKRWLPGEKAAVLYDADDIQFHSFFLGGRKGSMTNNKVMYYDYATGIPHYIEPGQEVTEEMEKYSSIYRLTIPRGVTLLEMLVGGSEDASVTYRQYKDAAAGTFRDLSDEVTFQFHGGFVTQSTFTYDVIVYNDVMDTRLLYLPDNYPDILDAKAPAGWRTEYTMKSGETIRRFQYDRNNSYIPNSFGLGDYDMALYDKNGKTLPYFGPRQERTGNTTIKITTANKFVLQTDDKPVLEGQDPREHLYGGNIYGGCYNSGDVNGDVILHLSTDGVGPDFPLGHEDNFGDLSSLKYNIGRVFGGGFGKRTTISGNTYVCLLLNFRGMNVFGGGSEGSVSGTSTVTYFGAENTSYVYGAIYGGGLRGTVGTPGVTTQSTNVLLLSGNVDEVYGGSCLGDLYGNTYVRLRDEDRDHITHLNYKQLIEAMETIGWGGARLIVGSVYGGNDIAGNIHTYNSDESVDDEDPTKDEYYTTTVYVHEIQSLPGEGEKEDYLGPGKTSPGSDNGFNGFPLIGNIYGGSNGNYGKHMCEDGHFVTGDHDERYSGGYVELATGNGTDFEVLNLGPTDPEQPNTAFMVPNIDRSRVILDGGTVINAFAGGNKSTVEEDALLAINYDSGNINARAGFSDRAELDRMWNVLHLSHEQQIQEVLTESDEGFIFDYQVYRAFGGNNRSSMAIQPRWELTRGYVGSVYSGGNFGSMTYFNPKPDPANPYYGHGLSLVINSPDFHAHAIYGGDRVGNISPDIENAVKNYNRANEGKPGFVALDAKKDFLENNDFLDSFYGSTVNILDGFIENVYGGNDVSGTVQYGARVNLYGAISGDVYGAGNGNYIYKYDPTLPAGTNISEDYSEEYGGRYFIIPRMEGFSESDVSDGHKLLAINAARPNIDRAYLNISGKKESTPGAGDGKLIWIYGRAFCGGNSATVLSSSDATHNDIKFEIGDNVRINNVYLGSNGEHLLSAAPMIEKANGIDISQDLTLPASLMPAGVKTPLDLYMRAVDVFALPKNFSLGEHHENAMIGSFFVGGNNGSMLTDRPISLTFPSSITMYNKIVGGCNTATVTYKGFTHEGGLTTPLADDVADQPKVSLTVDCNFEPWRMTREGTSVYLEPDVVEKNGDLYFTEGNCVVYGGCYNSGITEGGINIDVLCDMTDAFTESQEVHDVLEACFKGHYGAHYEYDKKREIVRNIDNESWRTFGVFGGGFGEQTVVNGDIRVRQLPQGNHHPSTAVIFGGSQQGRVVGNTTVEVRDGLVLTNLYGASESAPLYGSTHVIVGWPEYYRCRTTGTYTMARTDTISEGARNNWINDNDPEKMVVRNTVKYRKGDIVSKRVVAQMCRYTSPTGTSTAIDPESEADVAKYFDLVADDTPQKYDPSMSWDNIEISIGDQTSRNMKGPGTNPAKYFYGHGNIYGGGCLQSGSAGTLAGRNTVCYFEEGKTPDPSLIGYGGNSTILVWDNPENADLDNTIGEAAPSGAVVKDHVSVGTGYYRPVTLKPGQSTMGLYVWNGTNFDHQPPHNLEEESTTTYYEIVSDGGIYGGGRKVYTQGFRACEVNGYGYAGHSPQYPKLINSFQRMDLLSVQDCCMQLQGANDFATGSIDATLYSMTRISELEMVSTLPFATTDLDPGIREAHGLHNIVNDSPRSRNYLSFFHSVRYLSAITSNVGFDSPFHGANGQIGNTDEFTHTQSPGAPAHHDPAATPVSYRQAKNDVINSYYKRVDGKMMKDLSEQLKFDRRNLGTSANMIGINNGYTLRIMGSGQAVGDIAPKDYYGPINGVVEVKLLTLATNEGGGYIFALNQHDDPNHFLQTTGNFVFPGAAYMVDALGDNKYNYIYDDCFPVGKGWENYYGGINSIPVDTPDPADSRRRTSLVPVDEGHGDCNEMQPIHYWYVNGKHFFYNLTLTAYTHNSSSTEPSTFTLDDNDLMLYLYGVEPGSKFEVSEVYWDPSPNKDGGDLQNYGSSHKDLDDTTLDYRLYLSVDSKNALPHNLTQNADKSFTMQVARSNYNASQPSSDTNPSDPATAYPTSTVNAYSNYDSEENQPLLGLTLVDPVNNSSKAYYQDYLKEPEHVRIEVKSYIPGDKLSENDPFIYTFNVELKYLLGPIIEGYPIIENDALPGEYIYANVFDVDVQMDDENMYVSDRRWYIVPNNLLPDGHLSTSAQIRNALSTGKALDVTDYTFDLERQLHLPAWRYANGWSLIYEIVANGYSYFLMPHPDPSNYYDKPFLRHVAVHNYHRMRPYDGVSVDDEGKAKLEDLKFVEGCRIYIQDDDDLARFFEYLREVQTPSTRRTPDGRVIDPQYCEGLEFYLTANVQMNETLYAKVQDLEADNLRFKGLFHGNGFHISLLDNAGFLPHNEGRFYNTGFVATTSNKGRRVFGRNDGLIEDCFYYNAFQTNRTTTGYGLCEGTGTGQVVNCYQTAAVDASKPMFQDGQNPTLRQVTVEQFNHGDVAYNLNRFYLKKRYNVHTGTPDGELLSPVNDIYRDGEYRFVRWDRNGVGTTEAQRTHEVPNYRDYNGVRINVTKELFGTITGGDATYHNMADEYDMTRIDLDEEGNIIYAEGADMPTYHPIYPSDLIFIGQELGDVLEKNTIPCPATKDNRVYRASGFHGSKFDNGYHFNREALVWDKTVTAIDFTGFRDAENASVTPIKATGEKMVTTENGTIRWTVDEAIYGNQRTYFAPMIDLPGQEDETEPVMTGFTIDGPTQNLLVYKPSEPHVAVINDVLAYDETTPESEIKGHLIDGCKVDETPSTPLLHLVDLQNFNAPIEFNVTDQAWYQRAPGLFATGGNGWESICLPFTARTVFATISPVAYDGTSPKRRDHGELSHFFGPNLGLDQEAESHEYWLRRFTGADTGSGTLYFARPKSDDDVTSNTDPSLKDAERADYFYSNTYFADVYGEYVAYGKARPQYLEEGVHYANYPMLTERIPYIVAFPGSRYYEFDLSGDFYADYFGEEIESSVITYATKCGAEVPVVRIPVSDIEPPIAFTHDGFQYKGTYMGEPTGTRAMTVDTDFDTNGSTFTTNFSGSDAKQPFRAYMTAVGGATPKPMKIGTRGSSAPDMKPDEDDGQPGDEVADDHLDIYVQGHDIVVDSTIETRLHVYNLKGQIVRTIDVQKGENRYSDFPKDIYIVGSRKLFVR